MNMVDRRSPSQDIHHLPFPNFQYHRTSTMPTPLAIHHPRRVLILSAPGTDVLSFVKELTGSAPEPRSIKPTSPAQEHPTLEPLLKSTAAHETSDTTDDGSEARPSSQHDASIKHPSDSAHQPHPTTTTAGLTHTLPLNTKYYKAAIPIWLDEADWPAEWAADFCSEEARDVVKAIGAWIVLFELDYSSGGKGHREDEEKQRQRVDDYLKAVQNTIRATCHEDTEFEGVCLAVGWPPSEASKTRTGSSIQGHECDAQDAEEWDDLCFDHGFEFVDGKKRKAGERNAMGELQGMERVREALEANEWESGEDAGGMLEDEDGLSSFLGDEEGLGDGIEFGNFVGGVHGRDSDTSATSGSGIRAEGAELESEFTELKIGMRKGREEQDVEDEAEEAVQVEDFERMMSQAMAARGTICS